MKQLESYYRIDRDQIMSALRERVLDEFPSDLFKETISKYEKNIASKAQYIQMNTRFDATLERLMSEISDLQKRSNLNLIIGILIASLGIIFLGWSLLSFGNDTIDQSKPTNVVTYFATRFSFVVLVEIVGFFFLNLYKATLAEIKYFQNEITNVEARRISLDVAIASENKTTVAAAAKQMMQTERNFILNKGQSTAEIERERVSAQTTNSLLDKIAKIVPKAK